MTRATSEWIGKTDDAKVPDYVRLRIFKNHGGICHISKRKITAADTWDLEHIIALCNGGEHRESNMAPALAAPHKTKTKADLAQKAKNDRISKRHLGIRKRSTFSCSRDSAFKKKMDGTVVRRDASPGHSR